MSNPYAMPYSAVYGSPYSQYQYSPPPIQPQPQQPDSNMIWVQGDSGGKAYPVQNGKTVVLFDSECEQFFIKTVDASGIPQPLRTFTYQEKSESKTEPSAVDTSKFITREEFEEAIKSLKEPKQQQHNNNNNQGRNGKNG